jgi:hypothetical protein
MIGSTNVSDLGAPAPIETLAAYERYGPGETIAFTRPGDIILVRGVGWLGRLIRIFECLRYHNDADRSFAYWSHAAIVVGREGLLIEVLHNGVALSRLEKYRGQEYHYVHLDLSEANRRSATSYACACLHQKYGVLSFVLMALSLLAGDWLRIPDRGQQGCVALIARALQRAGVSFERGPADMMPADLAKRFGVRPQLAASANALQNGDSMQPDTKSYGTSVANVC